MRVTAIFLFLALWADTAISQDYALRQLEDSPRDLQAVQLFAESLMERYDKFFEYNIYDGAGHGYMRTGDDPEGAEVNVRARNKSWNGLTVSLNLYRINENLC